MYRQPLAEKKRTKIYTGFYETFENPVVLFEQLTRRLKKKNNLMRSALQRTIMASEKRNSIFSIFTESSPSKKAKRVLFSEEPSEIQRSQRNVDDNRTNRG